MIDTELINNFDVWLENTAVEAADGDGCDAHVSTTDNFDENKTVVWAGHNCEELSLTLEVFMQGEDFRRVMAVAGDTYISTEELPNLCKPMGDEDLDEAAAVKCEFEVGGSDQVIGILYEEGFGKQNVYNGVWTQL
jgi:hypothetical protein